ncbi:TPA: hypothetical protein PC506_000617 [Clostridioides difficile]|uniref:hypothetical protein n=1 Tax=Clostridioides TaxID=1870884 RepID=UPI0007BC67C5|nr:hypothetical protein [Clostridioides difficile]MCC0685676.1 hypothetical protein [Clostridioides sp. ZZV14-6345]UUV16680.1 hypothetical protein NQ183_20355 [Clostridioides difficile]CZR99442.1 hypothetical protein CDFC105_64280 [Clostridioides difficile]CZS03540.1 hypothetical protein CDFC105_71221 [Clostridioides difficile]HDF2795469.1 hypothetical protein [Clostridioides difficile]
MKDCIVGVTLIIFGIILYLIEPKSFFEARNLLVETISKIDIKIIVISLVIVFILHIQIKNLN